MWKWFVLDRATSSTGTCRCTTLRRTRLQRQEPRRWMSSLGRSITFSLIKQGLSHKISWPLKSAASMGKYMVSGSRSSAPRPVWPEPAFPALLVPSQYRAPSSSWAESWSQSTGGIRNTWWEGSAIRNRHTSLKKLNSKLLCDPTIPLLVIHPKESKAGIDAEIFAHRCSWEHDSQYWKRGSNPNLN